MGLHSYILRGQIILFPLCEVHKIKSAHVGLEEFEEQYGDSGFQCDDH